MTTGEQWFKTNWIDNGRIAEVSNMVVAVEEPSSIRVVFKNGTSGKLSIDGTNQTVLDVVAAYQAYLNPTPVDPLSQSVQSFEQLQEAKAQVTATANSTVNQVATKTGLPKWVIIVALIGIVVLLFRWLRKKMRRRR